MNGPVITADLADRAHALRDHLTKLRIPEGDTVMGTLVAESIDAAELVIAEFDRQEAGNGEVPGQMAGDALTESGLPGTDGTRVPPVGGTR
ncbi:hypothetical protein M2317_002204 [Microbacterium sp. ZKA21]|uniref:hypothetical protein n=1 Tax=Microbacterium sp. ZKA21 TaxID=3381694 RepID=UPI003D1FBEA2